MNIRGFLKWQFAGTFSSPSFYGFCMIVLGFLALMLGLAMPWPVVLSVLGFVIVIVDAIRAWMRFSYAIYQSEQRLIVKELERRQ